MALTCLVVRSWVRFTLLPVLRELSRKNIRNWAEGVPWQRGGNI